MEKAIPKVGEAVRGSRTGKPIMVLFDLLGRSWALGIIWNLSSKPLTFRALQDSCEAVSPSVLNRRIKELRSSGIVSHDGSGYCLTEEGMELFEMLKPIGRWAVEWGRVSKE